MTLIDSVNQALGHPKLETQIQQLTQERDEAIAQLQQVRSALGIAPTPALAPDPVALPTVENAPADPSASDRADIDPDVRRAIQAMIDLNERTNTFDHKWRISTDPLRFLLAQVGKSSTPKIVAGMRAMKDTIDTHHAKHGIGPRHNRKHGGTNKISKLINLKQ